ncbi:GH3 auxin-responsive promoter [Lishizhenia tianjinensis]|uniref:GH3 auxin-responsive promoter n=2 Tax=Lishizhenia tianjinensis TaxID=477690 RepID=A0A1I6XG27_9FLAO|nr:GH3 auxin-responsive promoter [Lishizhenia tianjinensis]
MPFNSIFSWLMKKRIHQIDLFRKYPDEVQEELFHRNIEAGRATRFGKEMGFEHIEEYKDFNEKVPLMDYESLKHWVDFAMKGEDDVLWPGETKWFAKSSGTTSDKSKFIPVTKDSLEACHYKGGKDLLGLYYAQHPGTKLWNGKHLIISGSSQCNEQHLSSSSYIGDLSAIIVNNLPWWAELKRRPSKEIALMSEWEEKIECIAQSTIKEDIHIIAGVPSWTMVILNRILEITGKQTIKEVWPNLELFMHGGVSFEPYRKEFDRIIGNPYMNYVESYNASEGFFGIQDTQDGDLLLMLDYGIFYEFIPMDKYKGVNSEVVIPLNEVKLGVNYAMVITTNGGLWRYIIGDTIMFTELKPKRFKVTGRTKSYINVFGEELIVENAEKAMSVACERAGAQVHEYTAGPIFMEGQQSGGHEWLIEFAEAPKDFDYFVEVLDNTLKSLNSDYEAKRYKDMALAFPKVHQLTKGSFNTWLKQKGKLGGQHKVPRLMNDRRVLEEVMEAIQMKVVP